MTRTRAGLAASGSINLAAGVVGAVVNLVVALVVGQVLGPAGAGVYFLVVGAATIAANVGELGADTGLVRFVSAARAVDRPQDVSVLVRAALPPVVAAGLLVAVAGAGLSFVVDVPWWALAIVSVAAGMLAVTAVLLALTRGFADAITYPVLQSVVVPWGRAAGVLVVAAAGGGSAAMLVAWAVPVPVVLAVAALATARHLAAARRQAEGRPAEPGQSRALWRFSAVRGVAAAVEIMLEWVDVLLVGALAGPAAAGVYAVVTRCVRASEVVQQAARVVVGPAVSGAFARRDLPTVARLQELVTAAMIWMSWPFFLVLAVFGDVVLSWFGPGFADGHAALVVLCAALALQTAAGAVQTVLLMAGRSTWQLYDKLGALVLMVVLDVALVPSWGVTGAAVAWAFTIVLDTAVVTWQVRRWIGVRASLARPGVAALSTLVVVGLPALLAREVLGASGPVLAAALALLGLAHLASGWLLRRRLGLPDLLAARAD